MDRKTQRIGGDTLKGRGYWRMNQKKKSKIGEHRYSEGNRTPIGR